MPDYVHAVSFDNEDALFDRILYRPWHSPLGTEPPGVSPGDRRIIGRLDGDPVSVTDLPPHIVHRSDPPGYAHPHQYFERGRDFLDWVSNTAGTTRFIGIGAGWHAHTRNAIAASAVRAALEWDIDGNILVMSPPAYRRPLVPTLTTARYVLHSLSSGRWEVHADRDGRPVSDRNYLDAVLDSALSDVCCNGDLFAFEIDSTSARGGGNDKAVGL